MVACRCLAHTRGTRFAPPEPSGLTFFVKILSPGVHGGEASGGDRSDGSGVPLVGLQWNRGWEGVG